MNIEDNLNAEAVTFGSFRSIPERGQIITYEYGLMTRSLIHAASETDPVRYRAEIANSFVEMADMLCQIQMLHWQLQGMYIHAGGHEYKEWDQVLKDGMERQLERMAEWKIRRESNT